LKTVSRISFLTLIASIGSSVSAGSVLVVNQGNQTVSVVDAQSLTVTGHVEQGQTGKDHAHEIAVSRNGKTAFVPIYGDSGVGAVGSDGHEMLFIDVASRKVTGKVDFGHGVRPHLPVVDPKTGLVYVTTELDKSIAIVNPKTRSIVGTIPTGAEQSHMLVLSHDGRLGYTANVSPGSVSVLDTRARKTLAVIPVADIAQRIAISADDRLVFTSDIKHSRLAVIDTATRQIVDWITLPGVGYGAAATKNGRWLLIALPSLGQLAVIDLKSNKVVQTIPVGKGPQEVMIRPDQKFAYVSLSADGAIAVVDLTSWKVVKKLETASGADGIAWAR
jgi:DNA-binding beta-propeller fold protein YncE